MKSFGERFREAREQKGVSISEAAAATRIKALILEELENNRLQRTHAPIYAKGFIRIYSEYLGLDPETLLEVYEAQRTQSPAETDKPLASRRRPIGKPKPESTRKPAPSIPWSRIGETLKTTGTSITQTLRRIPVSAWRQRLAQQIQAAKTRITARTPAHDQQDSTSERSATRRMPWQQRLHQAVRGPYRLHAAATVIFLLILILTLVVSSAVRRRPDPNGIVDETRPDPIETAPGVPSFEFTHEPPPPYYR